MEEIIQLMGKRVRLSNDLDKRYAKDLADLANEPEIGRRIGAHTFPYPYTEEDAVFFLEKNRKDGKNYFAMDFLIFSGETLLGVIGIKDINYTDLNSHIGYWIGKEHWNHGYATEALALLTDYCRDELHLVKLYTKVLDFNLASLRVLMKGGYRIEGYEEKHFRLDDGFHSMFVVAKQL